MPRVELYSTGVRHFVLRSCITPFSLLLVALVCVFLATFSLVKKKYSVPKVSKPSCAHASFQSLIFLICVHVCVYVHVLLPLAHSETDLDV